MSDAQPLSRTRLWELQREFFEKQAVGAWSRGIVPHYIASNAYAARSYAQVLLGWLRDIAPSADASQPIYIVELGAGAGRLAFHLLQRLFALLDASPLSQLRVTYVMSDFIPATIDFWRSHPQLRPWVDAGRLDFARFDADRDSTFALLESGTQLSPGGLRNPLGVVANYFFDSLRHDAFYVESGQLNEALATVSGDSLKSLKVAFETRPCTSDYYDDPALNQLLEHYRQRLTRTHLSFPVAALACLRRLRALAAGSLFVLSGDKGYHREEDLHARNAPELAHHGSVSLWVNYHALGKYIESAGGTFLQTAQRPASFDVCGLLLGRSHWPETRLAYQSAIAEGGPDDFFQIRAALKGLQESFDVPQLIAYLRWSGYDSRLFHDCFPTLMQKLEEIPDALWPDLAALAERVWENHFHIGEERNLAFAVGMLMFAAHRYQRASELLEASLRLHGDDGSTWFNLGMCRYQLGKLEPALVAFERALALDADLEAARQMRLTLESELRLSKG